MALIGEKVDMFGEECYVDSSGNLITIKGEFVKSGIEVKGYDIRNMATLIINDLISEDLIDSYYNDLKGVEDCIIDTLSDILLK